MRVIELYTDGGVYKKNPSQIGGAYAYIIRDYFTDMGTPTNAEVVLNGPQGDDDFLNEEIEYSSAVTPSSLYSDALLENKVVTNNNTELYAVVEGVYDALTIVQEKMERGELALEGGKVVIHVLSDSKIALGMFFDGYNIRTVPDRLLARIATVRAFHQRFTKDFVEFKWTNLAGHPTKKDIENGYRVKNGVKWPISTYNVRCDELCTKEMKESFG